MTVYHKTKEEWVGQVINNIEILDKVGEYEFSSLHRCGNEKRNYTYKGDYLLVRCKNCNTERKVKSRSLVSNSSKGCRHCAQRKDAIGRRKGSLVVESYEFGSNSKGRPVLFYLCKCDCGGNHRVKADIFNIGHSCSCKKCRKSSKFIPTNQKICPKRYFKGIESRAKKGNLNFTITLEDVICLLQQQNNLCKLSGLLIQIEDGTASLDRIDNSLGYTLDNIQWVHRTINYMKNELSDDIFISFCSSVHNYQARLIS